MPQHKHFTFRSGEQVLEHGVRHLGAIQVVLDELLEQDHGERVKMLLHSVTAEHRNLLGSVERMLEDASDKALNTYTQYTVEMPTELERPDEPLTTLGLIQWLQGLIKPLQEMFKELAEHQDADEASEMFAGLAQQLESHEMRVSKEYQRTEDL